MKTRSQAGTGEVMNVCCRGIGKLVATVVAVSIGNSMVTPAVGLCVQGQTETKVVKSELEWQRQLNDQEYYVTRQKGTERAYSGKFWDSKADGIYTCKCCGKQLFDSKTKFKSGTGWPSYFKALDNSVKNVADYSGGMKRIEVICIRCDAHLGHVFGDGPKPTGLRYCMNSVSLNFVTRAAAQRAAAAAKPAATKSGVKAGVASATEYGFESAQKLVEAMTTAAAENSVEKFRKGYCWSRLPESTKQKLGSATQILAGKRLVSMRLVPSTKPVTGKRFNVDFKGNISVTLEGVDQPVLMPYGEFGGRYYLASEINSDSGK
ncbi:MAG: peptide-methionine (R)-S-oxide reductase MsrB [Mariniblastus sp.]